VNQMAGTSRPGRNIADVTHAWERRSFPQDHGGREGEILELKETINTMVDRSMASPRK